MLLDPLIGEKLRAYDSAVSRGVAGTYRQQLGAKHRFSPVPVNAVAMQTIQPAGGFFRPVRAQIRESTHVYPPASLPGLPTDVRLLIYSFVEEDPKDADGSWNKSPHSRTNYLRRVSRQFYHELDMANYQHWLVPQDRINDLLDLHFFKEGIGYDRVQGRYYLSSKSLVLNSFNSLSLQVPFNATSKLQVKLMVACQSLPLTELKLFFKGNDVHGTATKSPSCGLHREQSTRKLPPTGQRFSDRARFVNSLLKLEQLETLVVSNANLPLTYNQVINNKPRLTKLSIVPDSRTSLHSDWYGAAQNSADPSLQDACRGSNIRLNTKALPPLLELEISANAMVFSSNVVRNVLPSLKKLTWIVPNPNHQAGDLRGPDLDWLKQTQLIIQKAAMFADRGNLEVLRICIEHGVYDTNLHLRRNDELEVGDLINSLQTDVKNITSLRHFEIHMDFICQFKRDGFYFVTNLGPRVERYYMSEKMITSNNHDIPYASVRVSYDEFYQDRLTAEDANMHGPASPYLSVHHNLVRQVTRDNFGISSFSAFKFKSDTQTAPVHEDQNPLPDRILRHKNLGFLAYEFTDTSYNLLRIIESTDDTPIPPASDLPDDDEDRFRLLRLNGRLLDRERNKHMYQTGYRPAPAEREQAASPDQRPARRYPVIVRAEKHDHWMCEI